jgi:putative Mg2+ transporter-C (MgtC) family protein
MSDVTQQLDLALRLIVAAILGGAIGVERERHDRPAGMRTHLLVSLGAAAFTILSIFSFGAGSDPGRVAAQIVTGIGFLGAGSIIKGQGTVTGLTTAASLWVSPRWAWRLERAHGAWRSQRR